MKRLILIVVVAAAVFLRVHHRSGAGPASTKVTLDGAADMSVTEYLENFRHNDGSPSNTFDAYEKRVVVSDDMEFNGKRTSEPTTDTDVPNPDLGEYDRITLTPGAGNLGTIKEDEAFYSKAMKKLVTLSSEHEIQLVAGTWDDYRSGRDVKFVASPRGIEQTKANLSDQTKALFSELSRSAVTRELEAKGVKGVTFTGSVQGVQIANDPVTANSNTVKIHDTGLTRVSFKFHGEGAKVAQ